MSNGIQIPGSRPLEASHISALYFEIIEVVLAVYKRIYITYKL